MAFIVVWLLWFSGAIWEYRGNRKKQTAAGWMLLLACVLAYALSSIESLGAARWALAGITLVVSWFFLKQWLKKGQQSPNQR
jgi:hypothetical protein